MSQQNQAHQENFLRFPQFQQLRSKNHTGISSFFVHKSSTLNFKEPYFAYFTLCRVNKMILTKRKSLHIYPEPTSNMLGVKIIQEFINKLLIDNSAWLKTNTVQLPQIGTISVWQTPHSLHSILKDFILPEYENDDVAYDLISNILSGIKCSVREFIGDNKWIMHFQTKKGRDIVIEKSIDYRIHDWTEKTESGQW